MGNQIYYTEKQLDDFDQIIESLTVGQVAQAYDLYVKLTKKDKKGFLKYYISNEAMNKPTSEIDYYLNRFIDLL
jgi:hypothetical protein